jgi:hypothetical protein
MVLTLANLKKGISARLSVNTKMPNMGGVQSSCIVTAGLLSKMLRQDADQNTIFLDQTASEVR